LLACFASVLITCFVFVVSGIVVDAGVLIHASPRLLPLSFEPAFPSCLGQL
jgi:hypothetical protein